MLDGRAKGLDRYGLRWRWEFEDFGEFKVSSKLHQFRCESFGGDGRVVDEEERREGKERSDELTCSKGGRGAVVDP